MIFSLLTTVPTEKGEKMNIEWTNADALSCEKTTRTKYIDADRLREKMFHKAFEEDSPDQKWDSGCWIRYHMFEDTIESIPTEDVRENVHGRWIVDEDGNIECSVCGHHGVGDLYCERCGAKMDERSENEEIH